MSTENTEETNLLSGEPQPRYVFQSTIIRQRHRRLRQFQCCICTILLCAVIVTLVFAVSYGITEEEIQLETDPSLNNTLILLSLNWPRNDTELQKVCVDDHDWDEAFKIGKEALRYKDETEKSTPGLDLNNPSYLHQKLFFMSNESQLLSRMSYIKENAYKYLARNGVKLKQCENEIPKNTSEICNKFYEYRSFDGTCNNLNHPLEYGVAFTPFRRALPPDYADGISEPRISKNGSSLPSARLISLAIHRPIYKNDNKFTIMLAVWGQFLDHDITSTALTQRNDSRPISCCSTNNYPECFPVAISENDSYYKNYNVTCMEFLRSATILTNNSWSRQQLNQASSFLDGSVVYGISINVTKNLREFEDGKLKMYITSENRTLLPISIDLNDGCNRIEQIQLGRYCFMSGDQRANENLYLTSMHLIWARHHNFLASNLKNINKHWDDERIFQEARKILIAQLQHITYNEFLGIILGTKLMKKLKLRPKKNGYYNGYDGELNPSIANNFATSAFRFGHTLIPALVKLMSNFNNNSEYIQLRKMLFNPYILYHRYGLDESIQGAINTSIEASDNHFNNELRNHLFERNTTKPCGLDLVSLNIQRGRDHGLPGYSSWREHCGLKRPRNFSQLASDIDDDSLDRIQQIYHDIDDVDLYTGGISEKPLNGGLLGPTFTCLILDQFVRIKKGDRMWYENPNQPQAFTLEQLDEIRLTSLAAIICDNSDNVTNIQRYVMQHVGEGNDYIPCKEVPRPNLTKWKDANLLHVHFIGNSLSVRTANVTDN